MYAQGITQGAIIAAQGGKFQHGFFAAAFSAGAEKYTGKINSNIGKVAASSVVGGTASVLGGGKFANGAITGAYVMLFNEMRHPDDEKPKKGNKSSTVEVAGEVVGQADLSYNTALDNATKVSRSAKVFGKILSGLSIVTDGLTVRKQYKEGGIDNISPVDATSLGSGIVGIASEGLSYIGIGGRIVYFIGGTASFIGAAIAAFQMNWMIYKPMNDLQYAPLYIDKNGEPYIYHGNPNNPNDTYW